MKTQWIIIGIGLLIIVTGTGTALEDGNIGKTEQALSKGIAVPAGELEAVGTVVGRGSCTATLISDSRVLTASHCFCDDYGKSCVSRGSFTLHDVRPVANPNTRQNITIGGTVRIHPEAGQRGWLREDYAVVELDHPASSVALVTPIPVEDPWNIPLENEIVTLVGFGKTEEACKSGSKGKMKMELPISSSGWGGIRLKNTRLYVCPGDSGGPILNKAGHVVGVASWGDSQEGSVYRPTSYAYNWIFGLSTPAWTDCLWIPIETGGINSHSQSQYCPEGSYLTALDLDGDRSVSGMDAPVIGQAKCCKMQGYENQKWADSEWVKIGNKGQLSHSIQGTSCPQGSYITGIDLDTCEGCDPMDSPVIGQIQCSRPTGSLKWGSSYWIDVGPQKSHQKEDFCLDGGFITQIDLDQAEGSDSHDSPVAGRVKCSCARPIQAPSPVPTPVKALMNLNTLQLSKNDLSPSLPGEESDDESFMSIPDAEMISADPGEREITASIEENTDLGGSDYSSFDLPSDDATLCVAACIQDPVCKACTYVKPGIQKESAVCYLKNEVPEKKSDTCCSSWIKP